MYFVYILRSLRKRKKMYYIGVTSKPLRRLREHNSPLNTGYTGNCKWKIIYLEGYSTFDIAEDREKKLKQYGAVWKGVMDRVKESLIQRIIG